MLKWLVKRISKKWLVVGGIISLLLLLIIYMNKKYIIYAISALITLVAIFFAGRWTAPKTIEVTKGIDQIVYKDTCMYSQTIIANVTTTTTTTHEEKTKAGKVITDTSYPAIVDVAKKDSIYTTVFEKEYSTGLMKMKFTTTVKANSPATAKIDLEYQLDTIALKEMTTVNNVVVVQEDGDNSGTIKYLPTETSVKRYGVQGGLQYTDKLFWSTGPYMESKQGFILGGDVIFDGKKPVGGGINLHVPIIKTEK